MSEYIYWQDDSGLYKREEIVRCAIASTTICKPLCIRASRYLFVWQNGAKVQNMN